MRGKVIRQKHCQGDAPSTTAASFTLSGTCLLYTSLDSDIVDSARSLISNEGTQFEFLVKSIETSRRKAREMEEDLLRLREETTEAKEALTLEREKWHNERDVYKRQLYT